MDKKLSLLLSIAIIWLSLPYILFTGQQLFSVFALILIFLIALASAIIFLVFYKYNLEASSKRTKILIIILIAIVSIFIFFEAYFNAPPLSIYKSFALVVLLVSAATAISIAGLYGIQRFTKKIKPNLRWIVAIIAIVIISAVTY